ncbi:ABC-type oligopeptide transport system [Corynebacterium pseudotuberculosis 267]|uniref:ATP-binding cassette domain-containing protein n=1 Tax=Corynebacterium pseudotuberculosis TaxID=1719 RepID=UPI0002593CE5|nr:ATP-binding cassette domain-containing protein [Corynebacterium pseudotuberculosis]AFH52513.1 ABC-type oligopeptide transport system [Corynebacterium pseudotuberculosis 267]
MTRRVLVKFCQATVAGRVEKLSFEVNTGAKLGVIGPSGAGKTTLISLITKMIAPDSGSVSVYTAVVGYIPQDPGSSLCPRMTVSECIIEPQVIRLRGQAGSTEKLNHFRGEIPGLLQALGLDPSIAGRKPRQLSGGQRQRVAIARALLGSPELVIADEAFSALDDETSRLLQTLLIETEATVIFVSHNVAALRAMCDQLLVMIDGTVRYIGPADLVKTNDPEVQLFLRAAVELDQ